jgi:hypothetical protein
MFRQALRSVRRTVVRTVLGGTFVVGAVEVTTHLPSQGRGSEYYHWVADEWGTPLMRRFLDPEGTLLGKEKVAGARCMQMQCQENLDSRQTGNFF